MVVEPSAEDLRRIARHEVTDEFFSSAILRRFAMSGLAPELPLGKTPEEIRGRRHFLPNRLCGTCHSGPMLNTTPEASVLGAGHRFNNTRTGELVPDQIINPFLRWAHYKQFFILRRLPASDRDLSDILAYLRLL